MAIVTLAFTGLAAGSLPAGSGMLIPGVEGLNCKAMTFSSQKWPGVGAESGVVLLRASLGRAGEEWVLQREDGELTALVRGEVAERTGLAAQPVASHVQRWGGALPQRRQHLLLRRHPLRRLAAGARRGHRDPRPRPVPARRADPDQRPAHPPAPRPHPGPRLLRAALPQPGRDRDLGTGHAGGQPARPHRPLHLGAALPGRGARAALRRLLPRLSGASGRSARRRSPPPRSPTAARPSATGSRTAARPSPTSPTTSPRSAPTSTCSSPSGSPASPSPRTPTC